MWTRLDLQHLYCLCLYTIFIIQKDVFLGVIIGPETFPSQPTEPPHLYCMSMTSMDVHAPSFVPRYLLSRCHHQHDSFLVGPTSYCQILRHLHAACWFTFQIFTFVIYGVVLWVYWYFCFYLFTVVIRSVPDSWHWYVFFWSRWEHNWYIDTCVELSQKPQHLHTSDQGWSNDACVRQAKFINKSTLLFGNVQQQWLKQ